MAEVRPTEPALFMGAELVADYAAFDARAQQVAGWLTARGVNAGDRVALFMKNCPEYLIVQYGAWYAGAVVVPINAKLHAREAAWIMEDSGAKLAFVTPALAAELAAVEVSCPVVDALGTEFDAHPLTPVFRADDDLCWLF